MPKISVIIPVYNTEKYLQRCLDSVINQSFGDIEIICINNGSTDKCPELLNEFAKNDKRIKVISFEHNLGAAKARNTGIDSANGEYISFLDSDDFLDLDFFEKLFTKAKETNADIVKGNYKFLSTNYVDKTINERIKNNKNNFCCTYCSAIFKKSLIADNKIYFPLLSDMEDPVFAFSCALKAKDIQVMDNLYVNIEERLDSLTRSSLTKNKLHDKITGLEKLIDKANEADIDEDCYANITSIWFSGLFTKFDSTDKNLKLIIADEVERLYGKITYKNKFCSVLKKYDTFLAQILLNKRFEDIIHYKELKLLDEAKITINELKESNKLIEDLYKDIINQHTKKIINNKNKEIIYLISTVNNYEMYNKFFRENPFVSTPDNIRTVDYDNTKENIPITKRYNAFLNSYDYSKDAWFIFCHCDWELMDDINSKLLELDKNFLYGPVGSRMEIIENNACRKLTGQCYERRRDGSGFRLIGRILSDKELTDTFDCQALIVHSSLIKNTNLRFDTNLSWDLYAEDFSIQAKEKFNIDSYAINLKCCHWSGYHTTPDSYYDSLEYINSKYPNLCKAGTVSQIGGIKLPELEMKDYILYKLRKNVKNSFKKDLHTTVNK